MKTTLTVDVEYDPELTDPDGLARAMDRLLETALSTPGIVEDCGDPQVGEFFVAGPPASQPLLSAMPDEDLEGRRRWVLYDLDTDSLLTTRVYSSYEEASQDAGELDGVLILPVTCEGLRG
jgi:hypothetical protein